MSQVKRKPTSLQYRGIIKKQYYFGTELTKLPTVGKSGWFSYEQFLCEIIDLILSRSNKPTSKQFERAKCIK